MGLRLHRASLSLLGFQLRPSGRPTKRAFTSLREDVLRLKKISKERRPLRGAFHLIGFVAIADGIRVVRDSQREGAREAGRRSGMRGDS